jgi:phage-related protein (TIGR01555 family)
VGADDGLEAWKPIDEANIKTLSFLHTFDRRDVWVETYYQNPRAPKFRQPETYRIRPLSVNGATIVQLANAGRGIIVHESRLVIWPGQPTTDLRRVQLNGWDDSVLQRCWDALRQVGEDFGAKSLLLGRVSQAIYKIKGLYAMLAGKEKEHLETRIGMLDASRSRARAVVLDTDEDFINVTQPLSGVEALMDRSMLRLASAADMPVTILMGQAPAGMQATGEADQETWERAVSGWRANVLRARHERIARLMLLAKDGPTGGKEPDHWLVKYRPVRTARPLDAANARKLQVDADAVLIDKGVVTAADVAIARCSPSAGGDIVLDQKTLQANVERQRLLADAPPKDNAELGTVGARATSVLEIINAVTTGRIARESGIAVLTDLHRFTLEVATAMLGPEAFKPTAPEPPKQPGPPPAPPKGEGAGAPQGSPGFDAGGDPKGEGRG